ncbi:PREDICTED: chymotrypsin-2-like [Ceratosolen solmsi marchali]|uniref:Chymotrypsin-2-like n=1 Tax=Ceratosolen solmsi marchali TaxID=326594 RepID=A0AAJ6YX22_9HYME|nr:PREDICTED: chymotrypsin-2-like [Ceratosolen solmsi marchali]
MNLCSNMRSIRNIHINRWLDISFILIKFAIFYNECNIINAKAIVGENVRQAEELEFPYVVALMKIPEEGPQLPKHLVCTGTLITSQDVLTAEHCVIACYPIGIEIIVDSIDLLDGKKHFPLWWVTYNHWALNNDVKLEYATNDIAIVKLSENVPGHIKLASIATTFDKSMFESDIQIVGWGKTNNGKIPRKLQAAIVNLVPLRVCKNTIFRLSGVKRPIHKKRLCSATQPYTIMDNGDSGGPLLFNDIVIGVNNGVWPELNSTFHPEQVNFHSSTFFYKDFILDVIEKFIIKY